MQIYGLKINNVLGARRVDLRITSPITLIAGFNGAAKSSIQESIRMAFTGQTLRVALKRDYPTMISEGAKTGKIAVYTDAGDAMFSLPDGAHTLDGDLRYGLPDALPYVLNAQGFAALTPEDRRTFLFSLTHCKVTPDEVKRRLLEKECAADKIALVLPMMASGFPAACEFAKAEGTKAKGAWQNVSGEKYGSKKALDWTADKPVIDLDAKIAAAEALHDAEVKVADLQQEVGALKTKQEQHASLAAQIESWKTAVATLPRLRAKLKVDEDGLAEYTQRVAELSAKAGTGPRVGLIHQLASALHNLVNEWQQHGIDHPNYRNAVATLDCYEQIHGAIGGACDPEAAAKLPSFTSSRDLMQRAVDNTKALIAKATAAEESLAALPAIEDVTAEAFAQLQQELTAAVKVKDKAAADVQKFADLFVKASTADKRTLDATTHATEVNQWQLIAENLAPDGIPAEMLAQALRPINTALKESSLHTGWRQPSINSDMSITAEGRAYALLCESEKWRVDALIAEAIAQLSDVRILMLDRIDVLDLNGRVELLEWLHERAAAGAINTALLFATLKQPPAGLPDTIQAVWLKDGIFVSDVQEAVAA
jgi:hypothetical protein